MRTVRNPGCTAAGHTGTRAPWSPSGAWGPQPRAAGLDVRGLWHIGPDRGARGARAPARLSAPPLQSPTVIPVLIYPDVREAVAWLTAAFGFVERLRIGENHRSQLRVGDGAVIVAEPGGYHRPPSRETVAQYVMVRVPDARSHCERARAHGAVILAEPADYMYGERQYGAEDFAGHRWTFTETLADTDPQTWGGQYLNPD